jgi:hypothetical protein
MKHRFLQGLFFDLVGMNIKSKTPTRFEKNLVGELKMNSSNGN